jgi:pyruvate kinase
MANVDKVLGILHRLTGQTWQQHVRDEPAGSSSGPQLLKDHTDALLGPPAPARNVRIMVTLPSEAASSFDLVRQFVEAGMDVARINCAHDDAPAWHAMALLVRQAAKGAQREVRILMDLGGPKVRTGALLPGPSVVRLHPVRDAMGKVLQPARLWLTALAAPGTPAPPADCQRMVVVSAAWLARLQTDGDITFADARGKKRRLLVVERREAGVVAQTDSSCYLTPSVVLSYSRGHGHRAHHTHAGGIAALPGHIRLHRGDTLRLTRDLQGGHGAQLCTGARAVDVASIGCTMPLVFDQVHAGERVWLDDGRIGGLISKVDAEGMDIEITQARDTGESLMADKGINFPDSALKLPALTDQDLEDVQCVAQIADVVGLSFVHEAAEIHRLLQELKVHGGGRLGVILKIETLRGFENLPALMLAAMAAPSAGVMIARGDLAVECGFERMAEMQEEILWCAEAAHMPVVWATQVLESLGKTGLPSRAEITDASMGVRAECVMLNKGPYMTQAIRVLDDILVRMAAHQAKKTPLLRALRAWTSDEAL